MLRCSHVWMWYVGGSVGACIAAYAALISLAPCGALFELVPHPVIVTAFETELRAVQAEFMDVRTCAREGVERYYAGMLDDGSWTVFYMSGIGPERSGTATAELLEHLDVSFLVFSGIAGAVDPALKTTETIVPVRWAYVHTDALEEVHPTLLARLRSVVGVRVVPLGATSDRFVDDVSFVPSGASIVDMETYAIAQAARVHDVPFIAVRSISDHVGAGSGVDDFDGAARASARVVVPFVRAMHHTPLE